MSAPEAREVFGASLPVPLALGARESARAYLARLAAFYHYPSIRVVLETAGVRRSIQTIRQPLDQLAAYLKLPAAALERACYWPDAGDRSVRQFFGVPVGFPDVVIGECRVCPACLEERLPHSGLFDLTLVTACERHALRLTSRCPRCDRRLSWQRTYLERCSCGFELRKSPRLLAAGAALRLASLLRRAADGDTTAVVLGSWPAQLTALDLRHLTRFLRALLARLDLTRGRGPAAASVDELYGRLQALGDVFADWPNGALAFLDRWRAARLKEAGAGVSPSDRRFSLGVEQLIKGPIGLPAFFEDALRRHVARTAYSRTIRPADDARYVGVRSAIRISGKSREKIKRLCAQGVLAHHRRPGTRAETVIELASLESYMARHAAFLSTSTAARDYGIPRRCIGALIRKGFLAAIPGEFGVKGGGGPGVDRRSVEALVARLNGIAQGPADPIDKHVLLGAGASGLSTLVLIEGSLAGKTPLYRRCSPPTGLDDFAITHRDWLSFRRRRRAESGIGIGLWAASKRLGVPAYFLGHLLVKRIFRPETSAGAARRPSLTEADLTRFATEFVKATDIVRAAGGTAAAVRRTLAGHGVHPVVASTAVRKMFPLYRRSEAAAAAARLGWVLPPAAIRPPLPNFVPSTPGGAAIDDGARPPVATGTMPPPGERLRAVAVPGVVPGSGAARIMEVLADGRVHRYAEIRAAVGSRCNSSVFRQLEALGAVIKVGRGGYVRRAGVAEKSGGQSIPPDGLLAPGSLADRIYRMISEERALWRADIVARLGTKGFAHAITRLEALGLVVRGGRGRYVKAGEVDRSGIDARQPVNGIAANPAFLFSRICALLGDGQVHRVADIGAALGTPVSGRLHRLAELGVVVKVARGHFARAGVTIDRADVEELERRSFSSRRAETAGARVRAVLSDGRARHYAEVARLSGLSRRSAERGIRKLKDLGAVVRVGRGRYIIADSQSGANSPQGLDDARARISEALADGRPRYRAELTTVVGLRNFSSAITTLCRAGAIVRVARGWYAKSGVALPCEERERDSEPARRQRLLSALLHGLLTSPRDAAELQDALGISRQVVVAQLKRMIDRGEVHRVALVAEQERYAYIRVGGPGPGVLSSRIPRLRKGAAGLLSRLTPEKPARLSDVAGLGKRGYVKRGVIEELQGLGLIERVGETKTPLIRLTSRGRDHPQYDAGAPKAPVLEDVIAGEARVRAILLALRALATATAMDLGLVTGIPRARQASAFRTTRWLLRLRALGLVETDGRRMASRPAYRLTKFGDEFVATLEGAAAVADAVEVQTRLAELRARWRDQQIARFGLGE